LKGISPLLKQVIISEKYYLSSPKSCQVKLKTLCENNNLSVKLPGFIQIKNYIYRYREQLIAQNYPEVKQFLSEIVKKTYNSKLKTDEMFFIYSHIENGEVALLFSAKSLLENLFKQQQLQPSFIHIDATFKLIDLGLPLIIVSTENIDHNYRPIAFYITWSESTEQTSLMLNKLKEFLHIHFNFIFEPKYIMTDNSNALISGCKQAFKHNYIHLGCHFHIAKRMRDKVQSKGLKDKKQYLFFGLKALKNSPTLVFFKKVWEIIEKYWLDNGIPKEFVDTFRKEYINKDVQWHYGASFPGKSRTNNSLESGNNVLKVFFNRKSHNLKEFITKMKLFVQEWSTAEKTSFPYQPTYLAKMVAEADKISKENSFLSSDNTPNWIYYPRKGISKEVISKGLQKLLGREHIPQDIDSLHEGWCYLRSINKSLYTCDCADFYKYNYCKHSLAIRLIDGELQNPKLKEKKARGRKANITKALEGKPNEKKNC